MDVIFLTVAIVGTTGVIAVLCHIAISLYAMSDNLRNIQLALEEQIMTYLDTYENAPCPTCGTPLLCEICEQASALEET